MAYSLDIDARISAEDLHFCRIHQKAYERSRAFLAHMVAKIGEFQMEQETLLGENFDEVFIDAYMGEFSQQNALERFQKVHAVFVSKLVDYFLKKYRLKFCSEPILTQLLPPRPKPSAANKWKYDKAAEEDYARRLSNLSLSYKEIVEQIFTQARAKTNWELKERAVAAMREKAHNAAWNCLGECQYTQMKQKIVLPRAFRKDVRSWSPYINLSSETANIMEALAFFESSASGVRESSQSLLYFSCFNWRHCVDGQKVKQVLCYKNGRIDIAFTSESAAQEFVEQYLGTVA